MPDTWLLPCTSIWGSASIITSDPAGSRWFGAMYRPVRPDLFLDQDPDWGLYDGAGALIEDGAYYRLPARILIGQSLHIPPASVPLDTGHYVYGGPVIMHFGHFLTAALPRLWQAARDGLGGRRILVHSHQAPDEWFTRDYVRFILGQLGLGPANFIRFEQPTRLRQVDVPRPAMQEQTYGHQVMRDLCRRIGAGISRARDGRPVYLSKSRNTLGTYKILNEAVIDATMEAAGVEIVHPQELNFAEQLSVLNGARAVLGTIGSAFHTSLFAHEPVRIVGLAYGAEINANYAIIDRLCDNRATYVYPATGLHSVSDGAATFCYQADDPAGLARALLDLLD